MLTCTAGRRPGRTERTWTVGTRRGGRGGCGCGCGRGCGCGWRVPRCRPVHLQQDGDRDGIRPGGRGGRALSSSSRPPPRGAEVGGRPDLPPPRQGGRDAQPPGRDSGCGIGEDGVQEGADCILLPLLPRKERRLEAVPQPPPVRLAQRHVPGTGRSASSSSSFGGAGAGAGGEALLGEHGVYLFDMVNFQCHMIYAPRRAHVMPAAPWRPLPVPHTPNIGSRKVLHPQLSFYGLLCLVYIVEYVYAHTY